MEFDPNNEVVLLCVKGMTAEGEGKIEEAHQLFQQAWETATNNFEAFTAAHYLARNQKDPEDGLKWNLKALSLADTIKDDSMKPHYPSLYLNVAKSYETLGNRDQAVQYYQFAADSCAHLPAGKYADMIKSGVKEGLKRVSHKEPTDEVITQLVNGWCERKDLKPLAMILPAYVANLGSANDVNKLISVFSYLSATRCLNEAEQKMVDQLIKKMSNELVG